MSKIEWICKDLCLMLSTNSDKFSFIPSANEIYAAEFQSNPTVRGIEINKPSYDIKSLSFSRFPLILFIRIDPDDEHPLETGELFKLKVIGKRGNLEVEIFEPRLRQADHIIVNKVWYPFERGSLDEIRKILDKIGINSSYNVTLKQYFDLTAVNQDAIKIVFNKFDLTKTAESPVSSALMIADIPKNFIKNLYHYQIAGYRWLRIIERENLGCILADEMGLGKTIQIICLVAKNVTEGKNTSLIIAPATLLVNWRKEFLKFAPSLVIIEHRGPNRTAFAKDLKNVDVVISSYETVVRDITMFKLIKWNAVILDEAQSIKNPNAQRTLEIKTIPRRVSIAVTGTPVENSLTDLWSILDFSLPGLLGNQSEFEKRFENDESCASQLEPIISPIILRRTILAVAKDLPKKIIIPQPLEMNQYLTSLYESLRKQIQDEYGPSATLVCLIKLRQFCAHPFLIIEPRGDPAEFSQKYQRLLEILEEIFENREKVLIFTSFTGMIDILLSDLPTKFKGIFVDWIDGRSPIDKRQEKVDRFNSLGGSAVLVLNPKAAGTGLNLTGANHVIHYNPEWNPATEDQASARSYRLGQIRPVTIHRLFFEGTVEEVINDRLERKRNIADSAIVGVEGFEEDSVDIMRALEITPFRRGDD